MAQIPVQNQQLWGQQKIGLQPNQSGRDRIHPSFSAWLFWGTQWKEGIHSFFEGYVLYSVINSNTSLFRHRHALK
jgi:hypothetical protein